MTKMEVKKQVLIRPMTAVPRASSPYAPKLQRVPSLRHVMDLANAIPSMPMTPPPGHRGMAVSPSHLSLRAKGKLMPKKMLLGTRDKEALLEEILELKRVLFEQDRHIKFHKVHTSALEIENKKLERDIEDLEAQGASEAPRTGGSSRLRAKLQGLKMRINDLQSTSDAQQEELSILRKDMRVSHTKEVEVERDVYAGEVGNLQKLVKRLSATHNKISCQNKELGRLKEKGSIMEANHQRLQASMHAAQDTLDRASNDLKAFRNKARETTLEASRSMKRCKELQHHSNFLEELLVKERNEKDYLEKKVFQLAQELRRIDTQLQNAKGYSRVDAFKGVPKKKPPEPAPPPTVKSSPATPKSPPKSPRSPRTQQQKVHGPVHQDVMDITDRLVNMASFHFEQSFKHKGE